MGDYPNGPDTFAPTVNGTTLLDKTRVDAWQVLLEAIQAYLGYTDDTPSVSAGVGSITSRVLRLESISGANITFANTAPSSPSVGDLWINSNVDPWMIAYWSGTAWAMLGASAQELGGIIVDFPDTPSAGYVVGYDGGSNTLVLMEPTQFKIIASAGALAVGDSSGEATELGMGEYGQFLQPKQDGTGLEWNWPVFRAFQQVGLSTPSAPVVIPNGVGGSTTYTYFVVAEDARGYKTLASTGGATTTGNATLSVSNFNRISWTKVNGAVKYHILKGTTSVKLSEVLAPLVTVDDIGQSTSAFTPAVRNETLDLTIAGWLRANGAVIEVEAGLTTAPALSGTNGARVYYDQTLRRWRSSQNGGAYDYLCGKSWARELLCIPPI